MARLNQSKRLLTLKIVYYGPGLSGKTSNLLHLHEEYPEETRGQLLQLDTETERTLFFDYFPANLGMVGGFKLKAEFFTVPGQSFYEATRRAVLDGADGIVFVADSAPEREEANLVAFESMVRNLEDAGRSLASVPHVLQYNKRDLPQTLPVSLLERQLNPFGAPSFEAVAVDGVGVWETQAAVLGRALEQLRSRARVGMARA